MRIIDSAVIIPLVTAYFYCVSTAYLGGFFGVLHLDSDVLDRNFHQTLYHGMTLNIWTLLTLPFLMATVIMTHSAIVTQFSRYIRQSYSTGKKVIVLKSKLNLHSKRPNALERKHLKRIKISWSVFLSCFAFLMGMVYFESEGKNAAKNIEKSIHDNKYNSVRISPKDSNKKFALLYCGTRNCAAKNIKTNEIEYFPQKRYSYLAYNNE